MRRLFGRGVAVVVGFIAALAVAGVAYAHTEVEIEPAVAGSVNAVMTVNAAAESTSAGIASVRVVLPAGMTASALTLSSGPPGWTLTPTRDGYSVGGPPLPAGDDAVHAVTIARLPEDTRLVFKTLVTYTDGNVDRWIEEPSTANPRPANPAPGRNAGPQPQPGTPAHHRTRAGVDDIVGPLGRDVTSSPLARADDSEAADAGSGGSPPRSSSSAR